MRTKAFRDYIEDLKNWDLVKKEIIETWKEKYGFTLSDEEENALKYIHGGGSDYSSTKHIATPLAAHVHHCDNSSASMFYNNGKGAAQKNTLKL